MTGEPFPGALREVLARREHELLAALVGGGEVPAGFDAERVRAQARALAAKRRSVEARRWARRR